MSDRGPKYGGINMFISLRYYQNAYGCYLHFEGIAKSPFAKTILQFQPDADGYASVQPFQRVF